MALVRDLGARSSPAAAKRCTEGAGLEGASKSATSSKRSQVLPTPALLSFFDLRFRFGEPSPRVRHSPHQLNPACRSVASALRALQRSRKAKWEVSSAIPTCSPAAARAALERRLQLFRHLNSCFGCSGCRLGLATTGKRRLVTAHTRNGHFACGRCSTSSLKN